MKKNIAVAVVGLSLAAAVVPRPANASCSTGGLQVCASIQASVVGNTLTLKVWNLFGAQGVSHLITFVGIGNNSFTGSVTGFSAKWNGASISTWSLSQTGGKKPAPQLPNNAVGAQLDFAATGNQGNNYGVQGCGGTIPPGGYVSSCNPPNGPYLELTFTLSSAFNLSDASTRTGWHSQVVNGTSCSLWVSSDGTTVGNDAPNCAVVPEPITMVLLGSGLAGLGGAGVIRRRKQHGDVVNG